ncbi:MAG TPA: lysylphosphatidylglycerol synthase transmembrane domain-containing protein [Anaerolineae bacterium]
MIQWAVAIALMAFLLAQISLQTLLDLLARVNLAGVILGAGVYMLTNVIRAWRVAYICDRPLADTWKLLTPTLASNFGNNVLPARAGEPIFIWAAHERLDLSWGTSSAVMIIMRVFDTMMVGVIFVSAAVVTGAAASSIVLWVVTAVLACAVTVTALLPWLGGTFVKWFLAIVRLTHRPKLIAFLEREGNQAAESFTQLRAFRIYLGVVLTSLAIWLLLFAWIFMLIRSLGIDVSLGQAILGSTFGILSKAVPFSSIGGWGMHEVGWTAGFMLMGFPGPLAISSGFAVNTLIIITSAICGLPAWLTLSNDQSLAKQKQSHHSQPAIDRAPVNGQTSHTITDTPQAEGER